MTISSSKADRRTDRRIARTRQLLHDALMQLIVEKGYDTITVQEIADRANVARTTFYLHFKDKDELLFEGMRELYEALLVSLASDPAANPLGLPFDLGSPADYEHVAKYADFYRVMLSPRGSMSFLLRVQDFLAQTFLEMLLKCIPAQDEPRLPLELIACQLAGSQLASIKWWLDHDMPHSPAAMAAMERDLMLYGTPWAAGMAPFQVPADSSDQKQDD